MWLYTMLAALYAAGVVGVLDVLESDYDRPVAWTLAVIWPLVLPVIGIAKMLGWEDDEQEEEQE